jgi:hypothetical protein
MERCTATETLEYDAPVVELEDMWRRRLHVSGVRAHARVRQRMLGLAG